jgi:hypothetical protein
LWCKMRLHLFWKYQEVLISPTPIREHGIPSSDGMVIYITISIGNPNANTIM